MPPTARAKYPPEETCIHCKVRKRTKSWPYCSSCRTLLIHDGVIKPKGGVPLKVRWKQYCDLWAKGMTQVQIAAELGLDVSYVSNIVKKSREAGLLVPTRHPSHNKVTEHGGGKQGIRGCDCEACLTRRRAYKKDWSTQRAQRRAQGEFAKPLRVKEHGAGTRGIDGCMCKLCVQRRKDYRKEWEEDVKVNGLKRKRNASVAQG